MRSIHKRTDDMNPGQRLVRLLASTLDPRAWAHAFKVLNYYNYTHVQEKRKARLGEALRISPTASFANGQNIVLGDRVLVSANASLWAGSGTARIVVGDDAMIGPGAMITAANYRFNDGRPIRTQAMEEADVVIGADVWLGYGVVVLAGATIGNGAIVAAGAVVRGHIPENAVVAGDPAKVVGYRVIAAEGGAPAAMNGAALDAGILDLIRREAHGGAELAMTAPIAESGIDSFDLISLRTALEARCGVNIPDREWSGIATLEDIARLPSLSGKSAAAPAAEARAAPPSPGPAVAAPGPAVPAPIRAAVDLAAASANAAAGSGSNIAPGPGRSHRRYAINMPQMALSGLSESWLFKELGDIHWNMITDFLRSPSSAIADEFGDRLYATFTRIKVDLEPTLRGFRENSSLDIDSELQRFGASFFFCNHKVKSSDASGAARTMSTFAKYGERGKNTSLIKGSPAIVDPDAVPSLPEFPAFGTEYRERRASDLNGAIFECDYEILPSHDINGVGLLYFAAYPTIFDLCLERFEGKGFLIDHSTVSKDICYFANSEPTETLLFQVHEREDQQDGLVRHVASLSRKGDGKRMGEVTSVKRRL